MTAEVTVLLKCAYKILTQTEDARLELAEMEYLKNGEVKLGYPAMLTTYYFPNYSVAFNKCYPRLQISIIDEGIKRIQQYLELGEIDIGIVNVDEISANLEVYPIP